MSDSPFKAPGIDGIQAIMLQKAGKGLVKELMAIYSASVSFNHIPSAWKKTRVDFIPKTGRSAHESAKDFRPISLTSFILKVIERVLDVHIRHILDSRPLSSAQHAYVKGRSTETAVHEVVRTVEKSLQQKQFTLAAFVDVEGRSTT